MIAVGLAALAACGDAVVTTAGSPTPSAACEPVERPPEQSGGHLLGEGTPPVPYSSTPGTSGWHAAGAPRTGVHGPGEELSEPEIVRILEVGGVVAAYRADSLPDGQVEELEQLAREDLGDSLTVTPFDGEMGAPLTLNAWGVRQACHVVDEEAVRTFVDEQAGRGPGAD